MRIAPGSKVSAKAARLDVPSWIILIPIVFLVGLNAVTFNLQFPKYDNLLHAPGIDAVALINAMVGSVIALLRWQLIQPWRILMRSIDSARSELAPEERAVPTSMSGAAEEVARLTELARESYNRYTQAAHELEATRATIQQFQATQQTIIHSASREITQQYQSVLTYAHYLEEQIREWNPGDTLREDFDDVAESSLNLKIIASALELLQRTPEYKPVCIAATMQQMMLALVPSLERRSMKLTSAEVDVTLAAETDATILTHVLWMMHLGIVRYAESESTLRLRCIRDHQGSEVLFSVVISALAPGTLSATERGQYLQRQIESLHPNMFAESIRIHANIQLAELLLSRIGGRISVVPLNAHACEICVALPAAKNPANS
jgi:hypothetical protein